MLLRINNKKKHSLNGIQAFWMFFLPVFHSFALTQSICLFKSERKQIKCYITSSSATAGVTHNRFFLLLLLTRICEKKQCHIKFLLLHLILFEFILVWLHCITRTQFHAVSSSSSWFIHLWEAAKKKRHTL